MLIAYQGSIVCQQKLLATIWPDDHETVPHNTFYQTTLNLRKSFTLVGYQRNIIRTVPKKGLEISAEIPIEVQSITVAEAQSITVENMPMAEAGWAHEQGIQSGGYPGNTKRYIAASLLCVTILLAGVLVWRDVQLYYYLKVSVRNSECLVYVHPEVPEIPVLQTAMNNAGVDCMTRPHIYTTTREEQNALAVIKCNVSLFESGDQDCIYIHLPYLSHTIHKQDI